jgi:hypothetical protein
MVKTGQTFTEPSPVSAEITGLIEQLATDNNGWGYQWIQGELLKLGYRVNAPPDPARSPCRQPLPAGSGS